MFGPNRVIQDGMTTVNDFRHTADEIEGHFQFKYSNRFFTLCMGEGRKLVVGYDAATSTLFLDRTNCSGYTSNVIFSKTFPKKVICSCFTSEWTGQNKDFH